MTGDGTLDTSGSTSNERFVELEDLAFTIRDMVSELNVADDALIEDRHRVLDPSATVLVNANSAKDSGRGTSVKPSVDCIYVDHDQYYDIDRPISKAETQNWKVILKTIKVIIQKGEQFVAGMADPSAIDAGQALPIFAVADISFWALREFGTCLMKRGYQEKSAAGACRQVTEEYPKFKRIIKTLGGAIENFMKRYDYWSTTSSATSSGHHRNPPQIRPGFVTILLYSRSDDRFDMISLESCHYQETTNETGKNIRRK